jgi:3-oxoacyl-[acyl-carrier protein] reductase
MDLGLAGKVALVTGSSRGIGRAIALALAAEGVSVVLAARGAEDLDDAVGEASKLGVARGVVVDVTDANGARDAVAAASEHFGGLDIVVNNVGGAGARSLAETDAADLARVLELNVVSGFNVAQAALPVMRERGGGVIGFVASIWGREAGGPLGYNVAKGAEQNLANAMARELAPEGIRVFSVAPGCIRHPGGSWDRRAIADPEGMAAFVEREIPWGRFGTAEEVADVVTFLVSPRASWVVGACLPIDGGQSRSL